MSQTPGCIWSWAPAWWLYWLNIPAVRILSLALLLTGSRRQARHSWIRTIINEAVEHRNYPIEYLAVEMNRETPGEEFALFNTAFLLENLQDKLYINHLPLQLIFSFRRTGHAVEGKVEYCFDLYQAETIREIAGYLTRLMKTCLENVNIALEDIDLLTPEEKKQSTVSYYYSSVHCQNPHSHPPPSTQIK